MKTKKIRTGPGGAKNCWQCVHCYRSYEYAEEKAKYRCSLIERSNGGEALISPRIVMKKISRDCPAAGDEL